MVNSRVVQALCPNRHSLDLEVGEVSGDVVMIKSSLVLHAGQLALLPKCFIDWFFFLTSGCGSLLAFCNEGERKEPFFFLIFGRIYPIDLLCLFLSPFISLLMLISKES